MQTDQEAIAETASAILRIGDAEIPAHIEKLRATKGLSPLIHDLNCAILGCDGAARDTARAALNHLGFI
ncbi:hypothetical protein LZA78_00360 [Sinirhodobacter sp. WL0062]|uniref:Uncharacterized protein n=1 Tax=Rhodobacter flavimaris TaxID=2907145 RepID=A0ABS8YPV5_9RHOB|nr:hypothetical protein [Sinirhodobacter sp. WL0062]MCE5971941.1 hypothetical protein [Sinirhodobacter sp. WL0062]